MHDIAHSFIRIDGNLSNDETYFEVAEPIGTTRIPRVPNIRSRNVSVCCAINRYDIVYKEINTGTYIPESLLEYIEIFFRPKKNNSLIDKKRAVIMDNVPWQYPSTLRLQIADLRLVVCSCMKYIYNHRPNGKKLMVSSFDAPSPQLTESLEKEGMNSFPLVTLTSRNIAPITEDLGSITLVFTAEIDLYLKYRKDQCGTQTPPKNQQSEPNIHTRRYVWDPPEARAFRGLYIPWTAKRGSTQVTAAALGGLSLSIDSTFVRVGRGTPHFCDERNSEIRQPSNTL
ncbi:hypothetical protein RF11_10655 [Thelohanellus kitauei]|uniref:Uncharacterized protein n=1 Tax=Thelohanellus kitauei TaxID=669202 RepID=A0A0C2NDM5_THEKT|nr:hypothetical protein RF11_10655 [Thelohanellus kitauei]